MKRHSSEHPLPQWRSPLDEHRGWFGRQRDAGAAQLSIEGGHIRDGGGGNDAAIWFAIAVVAAARGAGQAVGRGIRHQATQQAAHTTPREGPANRQNKNEKRQNIE